jgi:excisionase family DNA binding protein
MSTQGFTVYEAARELGCTSQWIRVLLAEQRLTGAQKIEGQWRIPAAALEDLKQRNQSALTEAHG